MQFAKYWAKGDIDWKSPNPATGQYENFFCWGWSDESEEDAAKVGRERAEQVAAIIRSGIKPDRYTYGDKPLKEEILESWKSSDGTLFAVVSINSYGCDILNTENAMFVDVDIDEKSNRQAGEKTAIETLRRVLEEHGNCGAYVYRTAGGLRYLLTLDKAEPDRDDVAELMKRMGADPLYTSLCRIQKCFRARLTPKPWRCGFYPIKIEFPCENQALRNDIAHWRAGYRKSIVGHAVCEYLGYEGSEVECSPEFKRVLEFHDQVTGAHSRLPLA